MASDYANRAADLGIQILGGMGYSAETDMQRYWRDTHLWRIGSITNEMHHNAIADHLVCHAHYEHNTVQLQGTISLRN